MLDHGPGQRRLARSRRPGNAHEHALHASRRAFDSVKDSAAIRASWSVSSSAAAPSPSRAPASDISTQILIRFRGRSWRRARAWGLSGRMIAPAMHVMGARLVARWLGYGLWPDAARRRAHGNDLVNARRVLDGSRQADLVLSDGTVARPGDERPGA
jgi:hypothetical protein